MRRADGTDDVTTPRISNASSASRSTRRGRSGSLGARVPAGEPRRSCASIRSRPYKEIARRGLGAISRAYLSADKTNALRRPSAIPGACRTSSQFRWQTARVKELAEIKGAIALSRDVARLRSRRRRRCSIRRTICDYRNLMAYDIKTGKSRTLFEAARIGDLAFNPDRTVRSGACAPTTVSSMLVRIAVSLHRVASRARVSVRRSRRSTSTSRPTARTLSTSWRGRTTDGRACRSCSCAS